MRTVVDLVNEPPGTYIWLPKDGHHMLEQYEWPSLYTLHGFERSDGNEGGDPNDIAVLTNTLRVIWPNNETRVPRRNHNGDYVILSEQEAVDYLKRCSDTLSAIERFMYGKRQEVSLLAAQCADAYGKLYAKAKYKK